MTTQAIRTRFHYSDGRRGFRITATLACGSKLTTPIANAHTNFDAHRTAAKMLCDKLGLPSRRMEAGVISDGYVFVFADDSPVERIARQLVEAWDRGTDIMELGGIVERIKAELKPNIEE